MQIKRDYAIFFVLFLCLILLYFSFNTKYFKEHFNVALSVLSNIDENKEQKQNSVSTDVPTGDDMVRLLARLINGEARGEPYEGQTDDDPSCSPEGIETIELSSTIIETLFSFTFPSSLAWGL